MSGTDTDFHPSELESGGSQVSSQVALSPSVLQESDPEASHFASKEEIGSDYEQYEEEWAGSVSSESSERSTKRRRIVEAVDLPFKRRKGTFNIEYLNLLNQEITNAGGAPTASSALDFEDSQLGSVGWSGIEKSSFFSALGRLGRDDIAGIAARVGSKSPLEVRQYLILLEETEMRRRNEEKFRSRTLLPVDIPAALDVSQECCHLLESAADDISLRQEDHEAAVEQKRWGDRWLITRAVAQELDDEAGGREDEEEDDELDMPSAKLFTLSNWLTLSDRIFMNSAVHEYNWHYISAEPPAIRATAVTDLYSLVLSVLRRLVSTTLYISQSRIKSRTANRPSRLIVKAKDVRAAAASLGMKTNGREFWAQAARRLRLNVLQGEAVTADDEPEASLSFDRVESLLGFPVQEDGNSRSKTGDSDLGDESQDLSEDSDYDTQSEQLDSDYAEDRDADVGASDVEQDLNEAIFFSDAQYAGTTRAKQALRSRIEGELRAEADADAVDARAGAEEEARLRSILRKDSNMAAADAGEEKNIPGGSKRRIAFEQPDENWRRRLRYHSEWEVPNRHS